MSEQIWTQQQRENTMRQLAQKMSHLTSRPFADLIKLATSLEELAFNKAAGSQKEYITVLSKRMKKLEAQFTGQQPAQLSQASSSFAPVAQQPQQYQQPQAAMAQRQHQLFLQQQQLQLQQQQQQQQLAAQQQQQMHMQKSQQQQQQQAQQQAQSMHLPQQSTGMSTGSHEEDFANMADMFGLYNGAASATATSHQQQQTYLHAHRLQQQQAVMPQIPRQGLNADQLKQQQQQQLFQQQQRQQHMRHQQAQHARQQQQLQQLRHQQQQQAQQAQQPATAHPQQSQSATSWQQPTASSAQLQTSQQMPPAMPAQPEKDNQARIAQFWEIQGQLRKRYLPQLQALKDNPFLRSQHISQALREYLSRATHVSLLRQDDPASLSAVTSMSESKLAQIRKLYHELEGKLKAATSTIIKLQEELGRKTSAQRAQSQTPPPSQGLASPSRLPRPATPKASAPPPSGSAAPADMAPKSRGTSLLGETPPATAPISTSAPAHPLPPAAAPASEAAAAPAGGLIQPNQTHAQAALVTAGLHATNKAGAFPPPTHMQTDSVQAPANSAPFPAMSAQGPASSAQAAPSLISAVTQVDGAKVGASAGPMMQSLLEDGHMFMPAMPAELQAELASSASSSFNGIATFGMMQQQLSSTFDSSTVMAGDLAADMLSSPRFAVTDQDMNGGSGGGASAADEAAAASVAAVNAAVSGQMSPGMNTAAFNAAAGAALSRAQTAPPIALLDQPLPQTPTVLSTLASTAYADETGNDPNSPASATTGHVGVSQQKGGKCLEVKEAHSSHSAPCLSSLGKRRASESNITTQMDVKRSRAHLAHVEAAIQQSRETFKGVASLEATDSLYSPDCIMLTCTPAADSATAGSADTWRVITLRISSSYPNEPPSVVVRMSRDAQLAPQGEAVRSVLETSLSTLPFPPALEGILRCWLSAIESVGTVFSSQQRSASQAGMQTTALEQLGSGFSQASSFPMQGLLSAAKPAVISVGSLAPLPNPTVASQGNSFSMLNGSAATAGPTFSALATSSATAGAPFPAVATSSATAATLCGGSGIPQVPTSRHCRLQKQLSTGTQHSHAMLGAIQPGMPTACILPNGASPSMYSACNAVSNPMGSIESLVTAGLLPQGSLSSSQGSLSSSHALPPTSLGHLAAMLDLPRSSALVAGIPVQAPGLQ